MSNCPKCGYPIAPDETVCANCGEPAENINEETVSPESVEKPAEGVIEEAKSVDSQEIVNEENDQSLEEMVEQIPELQPETTNEEVVVTGTSQELSGNQVITENSVVDSSTIEVSAVTPQELPVAQAPVAVPIVAPSTVEVPAVAPQELPVAQAPVVAPIVAPSTVEVPAVAPQELPVAQAPVAASIVAPSTVEVPAVAPQELPVAQAPVVAPIVAPSTVEVPLVTPQELLVARPETSGGLMTPDIGGVTSDPNGILMQPSPLPIPESVPEVSIPTTGEGNSKSEPRAKSSIFNKIMFFLVFLVSIAAIALLAFFITKVFSSDNTIQGNKIPEASREYHYEGFNLYIPAQDEKKDSIHAEVYNGEFYIGTNTWSAIMTLQTGTYNNLLSNKSQLIDYFKDMGYETTEPIEKEISGVSFVKMEVVMGSKNVLVAYAKASGTKLFGIVLENETGEYADDDLKVIGTLLATAKYVGPEFSLPEGFQLDLFKETFMVAE